MRQAATQHQRMRGYLLIEALITLLIAAGAFATLMALQLDLQRQARLAAERVFAAGWAEHSGEALLGRIRAGDAVADNSGDDTGADSGDDDFWPATAVSDPAQTPPGYWKRWTLSPVPLSAPVSTPAATSAPLSMIEVIVEWPQRDSDPLRRLRWHSAAQAAGALESAQASVATVPPISP